MTLTADSGNPRIPLAYAVTKPRRPGILSALGVMSILLGSLSALYNLAEGAGAIMTLAQISRNPSLKSTVLTIPTPTIPPTATAQQGNRTMAYRSSARSVAPRYSWDGTLLLSIESFLSLGLSVFLIVAGSLLLAGRRIAGRFHRMYVLLKFALNILWGVAVGLAFTRLGNTVGGTSGAQKLGAVIGVSLCVLFVSPYPIALWIILSTRKSKEHFRSI